LYSSRAPRSNNAPTPSQSLELEKTTANRHS
jgi:hypothetical protein